MIDHLRIKQLACDAGFDLCGITSARRLTEEEPHLGEWLARGYQATMGYMERNVEKRTDPTRLVEGARTVVVCAVNYKNHQSEGYPPSWRTKVASYACSEDYHITLKTMLWSMFARLKAENPSLSGRAFVDTAPLLEKKLAVEAGLGWIGRQSLLVTPRYGSYVLLGELVLGEEVDHYDLPFEGSRCGSCHNCIDSCPTHAIVAPKVIDSGRCISCHTIEREGMAQLNLDGWIFGCDRCQSCCPYNRKTPMHGNPCFDPLFDPCALQPADWLAMSPVRFAQQMGTTPLPRSGLERIQRYVTQNIGED